MKSQNNKHTAEFLKAIDGDIECLKKSEKSHKDLKVKIIAEINEKI